MTNNQDRAAKVIQAFTRQPQDRALLAARALATHQPPLLAPDLPRADRDGRWWPTAASIGNVNINPAGEIVLHSGNFRDMQLHLSPDKADDLADILKAASAKAREREAAGE